MSKSRRRRIKRSRRQLKTRIGRLRKRKQPHKHRYSQRRASPLVLRTGFSYRPYRKHPLKYSLSKMNHIIFWDIDNWSRFFEKLKFFLPVHTFVWGFHSSHWNYPVGCLPFHRLEMYGRFYKNYQSGKTKNAADFAMMLQIGKMDQLLPKRVQFTILSGDKGFQEALHQLKNSRRVIRLINPHIPRWQEKLHHILKEDLDSNNKDFYNRHKACHSGGGIN